MLDGIPQPDPTSVTPAKPECVRVATIRDERPLFDLLWQELHRDNDMGFSRDAKKVWAHVNGMCREPFKGIAGVIDHPNDPDVLIGAIGIVACQQWYSQDWILSEVFLFLHPEFRRGTRYGEALFEFAKWHRADLSARTGTKFVLEMTVLSDKRLAAKERLWGQHGRKVGATFVIEGD